LFINGRIILKGFWEKIRCKDVGWIQLIQDRVQFFECCIEPVDFEKAGYFITS
jgi:hypothetical protein